MIARGIRVESLDAAIQVTGSSHDRDGECPGCVELGNAMFSSQEYRKLERQWVVALTRALEETNTTNSWKPVIQVIRMSIKDGIDIGLALADELRKEKIKES